MDNLHSTFIYIDSVLMTMLMVYLLRYSRNMTNISKKMSDHKKTKKEVSRIGVQQVYFRNSGIWLVCDCSGIQMVCESHKND